MPDLTREARDQYQAEVETGKRAERLLKSEEFQVEMIAYESELEAAWRDSNLNETERREECYRQLRAVDEIKARLHRRVETGKLAATTLDMESTEKE
jgi:hypothetical protein